MTSVVPLPTCPWALAPQHHPVWSILTPQVCPSSLSSELQVPGSWYGVSTVASVVPLPTAPASLSPQHHPVPSVWSPQVGLSNAEERVLHVPGELIRGIDPLPAVGAVAYLPVGVGAPAPSRAVGLDSAGRAEDGRHAAPGPGHLVRRHDRRGGCREDTGCWSGTPSPQHQAVASVLMPQVLEERPGVTLAQVPESWCGVPTAVPRSSASPTSPFRLSPQHHPVASDWMPHTTSPAFRLVHLDPTVSASVRVAGRWRWSVKVTVNSVLPACRGVPEIVPVSGSRTSPAGSCPPLTVHVPSRPSPLCSVAR